MGKHLLVDYHNCGMTVEAAGGGVDSMAHAGHSLLQQELPVVGAQAMLQAVVLESAPPINPPGSGRDHLHV